MQAPFNPQQVTTVFFDMNGTLLDTKASFKHCFMQVMEDYVGRWNPQQREAALLAVWNAYEEAYGKRGNTKLSSRTARQRQSLKKALELLPLRVTETLIDSYWSSFHQQLAHNALPISGTAASLRQLASRFRLGIISNTDAATVNKQLEALHLTEFFPEQRRITASGGSERKPRPAFFKLALQKSGCSPRQAVMVGNSWSLDIIGAARSGMGTVWFRPGYRGKPLRLIGKHKVYLLRSMNELPELFSTEGQ